MDHRAVLQEHPSALAAPPHGRDVQQAHATFVQQVGRVRRRRCVMAGLGRRGGLRVEERGERVGVVTLDGRREEVRE